jgi:hypothetical protein
MKTAGLKTMRRVLVAMAIALLLQPRSVWACAACYGQSDSPMAKGMNWGIFSLMGVVGCVLGTLASFFVFLGKRAASTQSRSIAAPADAPETKV